MKKMMLLAITAAFIGSMAATNTARAGCGCKRKAAMLKAMKARKTSKVRRAKRVVRAKKAIKRHGCTSCSGCPYARMMRARKLKGGTKMLKPIGQPNSTKMLKPIGQPGGTRMLKPIGQPGGTRMLKPIGQPGGTKMLKPIGKSKSLNLKFLQLQGKMQHESRKFQSISNVLKNRKDTAKNSIRNIN